MSPPEHRVRLLPAAPGNGETLRFEIDGKPKGVTIRIGQLSRALVTDLPDEALDLIEIAALVYAVDASVTRGGPTDRRLAEAWYRRFALEMPVRNLALWTDPDVRRDLEETLAFLSGDRFEFDFRQTGDPVSGATRFFEFGNAESWRPDAVMLFSGGLDSFAGALEEIIERSNNVALVSHFSSTKLAPIQRRLCVAMGERLGKDRLRHFPTRVQLTAGTNREGTHRTRSFLFAALGVVTASVFTRSALSFHENGVVSLNLPPVGNVLSTRATRTTHPQTLDRFRRLFSRVFKQDIRVDNPLFWRTKTDVLRTIERLGMADQIRHTRSCADTHNQTTQHPHCGRCSQCVDRRFAVIAAKLEAQDPEEAYRRDVLHDARLSVQDKEIALSYLRNALFFETMAPVELERRFPAILGAVEHVGEPAGTSLPRLTDLLARHGRSVTGVIRAAFEGRRPDQFPEDSLPWMFGEIQRGVATADGSDSAVIPMASAASEPARIELAFDRARGKLLIDGAIEIGGVDGALLLLLADAHLGGVGQGLDPLDQPTVNSAKLCDALRLADEGAVRKRINRARGQLGRKFESAGRDPDHARQIIENIPWHGYRLDHERVTVRVSGPA